MVGEVGNFQFRCQVYQHVGTSQRQTLPLSGYSKDTFNCTLPVTVAH